MALPVIDNFLATAPETHIEVWCGRHTRAVFECHPGVSAIVEIPSVPTLQDVPGPVRHLRRSDIDGFLVLDRSRLLAGALRAAGVTVLGSVRSLTRETAHETDCYLDTLIQAGMAPTICRPSLAFDRHPIEPILDKLDGLRAPFVVLHPGGAQNPGTTMLAKRWPETSWREVIRWLEARPVGVVLTGSPDEAELCRTVAAGTGASIAAGQLELIESAALAASARAYAGPDTGLTHLAAAAGTPVIALFGPTNPRRYAPRGERVTVLAAPGSTDVATVDLRKASPGDLPKMADIPPQAVIDALDGYLQATGDTPC